MSDSSKTVPPEQLPSEDLHPPPMPVINLGHLLEPTTRSCVVEDIGKACRDLGYFQVINHGISQSVMDGAVEAASDFFKLPSEAKEEFASDDLRQPVRYDTSSKDGISMSRAFLKHYAHPLSDWMQYWPENPAIILLTSCRGLEVVDRNSNSWKVVQQLPHALHVHVGDHMEVLSNGRIKTVVHRALLNPEEERISIASINGFALHEKVSSAKELVNEQNPKRYKESSFNDFLDHLTRNMDKKHMNFLESLRI